MRRLRQREAGAAVVLPLGTGRFAFGGVPELDREVQRRALGVELRLWDGTGQSWGGKEGAGCEGLDGDGVELHVGSLEEWSWE